MPSHRNHRNSHRRGRILLEYLQKNLPLGFEASVFVHFGSTNLRAEHAVIPSIFERAEAGEAGIVVAKKVVQLAQQAEQEWRAKWFIHTYILGDGSGWLGRHWSTRATPGPLESYEEALWLTFLAARKLFGSPVPRSEEKLLELLAPVVKVEAMDYLRAGLAKKPTKVTTRFKRPWLI